MKISKIKRIYPPIIPNMQKVIKKNNEMIMKDKRGVINMNTNKSLQRVNIAEQINKLEIIFIDTWEELAKGGNNNIDITFNIKQLKHLQKRVKEQLKELKLYESINREVNLFLGTPEESEINR